ncbi:hypothetical protein [Arthrobacter sp. MYb214]|uniref:hypothetical protein n=1 Tax=Arthrobacter sp. MYb214 TaxID=1848596 RepID=UPI0015E2B4F6|nr:hypothetical protein [Arthrobacter sp. MYb214]
MSGLACTTRSSSAQWGSLLPFRQPGDVDFFVVRENIFEGTERETLVRETAMTRTGIGRTLSPTH